MAQNSLKSARHNVHPDTKDSPSVPGWLLEFLGLREPWTGSRHVAGHELVIEADVVRVTSLLSRTQAQTEATFGFKWHKRDTFESEVSLSRNRAWLRERYGDIAEWLPEHGDRPMLLDAGCGAGVTAIELLKPFLDKVRYLGVDVSRAVDVAAARFAERGLTDAGFMQADICDLPLPAGSMDVIISEGVLHHTDSTRNALAALARLLKPGGRVMFYVYRKKGPIREFTDDLLRARLLEMTPQKAWRALEPLTQLGIALGELDAEIDILEPIDLLDIPAGKISVQRLFYWHVAKAFYHPNYCFDEMNHVNYDWYAPANAHRQSLAEVLDWCAELGLAVERQIEEAAGITIIARKEHSLPG